MKKTLLLLTAMALPVSISAQQSGKTLAATIDVYVFPASGQESSE